MTMFLIGLGAIAALIRITLLSNQYWKAGEAQKIYKQFGMKWSYL